MYNSNLYIFPYHIHFGLMTSLFFWLRNVMFCESPKKVGLNVARMNTWSRAAGPGRRMTPKPPPNALQVTTRMVFPAGHGGIPKLAGWLILVYHGKS